jgi:ligand-binding SRPBCC domain-containing protein
MPLITITTTVNAPINIVFDLARSIDLHKISTEHTNEEAVAGRTSGLIGPGESVTWRARHFGVTQCLTSKITAFDAPRFFTDEMVSGAFKNFKHDHLFVTQDGVTIMTDVFDYRSPYGIIGKLMDYLFLKKYMQALLAKRKPDSKRIC